MGTTYDTATSPAPLFNAVEERTSLDAALTLARIGVRLEADRVELWTFRDEFAELASRWVSSPEVLEPDEPPVVPRDWFPWHGEELAPHDVLVTHDAALFPLTASREPRSERRIDTAVILPLRLWGRANGAVCVHWLEGSGTWDPGATDWLYVAGLDALEAFCR